MLLFLAACAPSSEPPEVTPWQWEPQDSASAPPSATELESALNALLADLPRLNAWPVIEAYRASQSWADAECPQVTATGQARLWSGPCSTADGAEFVGHGSLIHEEDEDFWSDSLFMEGRVDGPYPDNARLAAAGSAWLGRRGDEQVGGAWTRVDGAFLWSEGHEDSWLNEGLQLGFHSRLSWEGDWRFAQLHGRVGLPDGPLRAMQMSDLQVNSEQCLRGSLWLREVSGTWSELPIEADCCAPLRGGALHGEAICLDRDALLGWEQLPW